MGFSRFGVAFVAVLSTFVAGIDCLVGTWSVGDCIRAEFGMNVTVHFRDVTGKNVTETISVPSWATAANKSENCVENSQQLQLSWSDVAKNDTAKNLTRSLVIEFGRNVNESYYGVFRVYGTFMMGMWTVNKTDHNSTLSIDTHEKPKLLFHTPMGKSFTCANLGDFQVPTSISYDNQGPPSGMALPNSNITTFGLQFDAFRTPGKVPPKQFRAAVDCMYQPNDVVPIVVGVALAILVIVVLVAYLVGRRRNRHRGYQSV